MSYDSQSRKSVGYAVCTAMAAVLVAGCASTGSVAMTNSATTATAVDVDKSMEKDVARAEKAVAKAPADAALRAELANQYLAAGRFESAVTTFQDAQVLGDGSARTALSLALAHIGAGNNAAAVAVLDGNREILPATDLGLALALAGDTGRGVAILSDALRAGDGSPKLRQNLAYAYALDGRWREARVMAAQDVPADQLDARISEWARQGRPSDYRTRVASLLGAPVRDDMGQPQYLALNRTADTPEAPTFAAAEPQRELPPVEQPESFWSDPAPVERVAVASSAPAMRAPVAAALVPVADYTQPAVQEDAVRTVADNPGFVSSPIVQPVPVRAERPAAKAPAVSMIAPVARESRPVANGTHLIQLGSFSSPESAERAWKIFVARDPSLASYRKTITPAKVRGKNYWRVAAAGFDAQEARAMCGTVRSRGRGCIAYAETRPLPGALERGVGGSMRAR